MLSPRPIPTIRRLRPRGRTLHASTVALASVFALAAPAAAQPVLSIDSVIGDGGTRTTTDDVFSIDAADCANPSNTTVTLLVTGATTSSVYLWFAGSSASCETQTSRTSTTKVCDEIGSVALGGSGTRTIEFTLEDIVGNIVDVSDPCTNTATAGTTITLYAFFTSSDPASSGDIDTEDFATIDLTIDVVGPVAPDLEPDASDDVVFLTAENSVTIEWDANGDESLETYRAVYDNTVDESCENSTATGDLPYVESDADATSMALVMSTLGLSDTGDSALVYLLPVDQLGNEGTRSDRSVCVTKVDALDFCEYYETSGEGTCPESCAARGAPTSLLPIAFALLFLRRRRAHG